MELKFLSWLREYLTHELDRHQVGFVPGMATAVNIELLLRDLGSV